MDGIHTHIASSMVTSPAGFVREAEGLRFQGGVDDPFGILTVDEGALCAVYYHGIASRLKELARGHNRRGTVGTGAGEAYRYLQRFPELAIRMGDLRCPGLREKVAAVRDRVRADLAPIIVGEFLPEDRAEADEQIDLLMNDDFLRHTMEKLQEEITAFVQLAFELGRAPTAEEVEADKKKGGCCGGGCGSGGGGCGSGGCG